MKKVLSAALALGLVAGVATTASAAYDSFSISGFYLVEGNYASNITRLPTFANRHGVDSNTLLLSIVFCSDAVARCFGSDVNL